MKGVIKKVIKKGNRYRYRSSPRDRESLSDLRAELTGAAKGTKASIARVLTILQQRGELVDTRLGGKHEEQYLVRATTKHGNAKTPFGTVVQRMKIADDHIVEFVHPFCEL